MIYLDFHTLIPPATSKMTGKDSFCRTVAFSTQSKDSPFYKPTLDNLSKEARDLLENYSGIEPDRVVPHVEEIVRLLLATADV